MNAPETIPTPINSAHEVLWHIARPQKINDRPAGDSK